MKKTALTVFYFVAFLLIDHATGWNVYAGNSIYNKYDSDSITIAASQRYSRLSPLKWFFMGTNYRKEWGTPVKMPIFHLNTTKGGFTVEELGGGQQTKSLKLKDTLGKEWVLRTIDKEITSAALPKKIRSFGFVKGIMQDQISAAYPYAPLTLTTISNAVKVPVTPNELFYVPNDPALGKYRHILAHRVCLLEPEPEVIFPKGSENTDKAYSALRSDNKNSVLQKEVLKARLLDMLIADWDRHKNQWDWSTIDSNGMKYFFPVPEDRDQTYFKTDGMLAKIIRLFTLPNLIGFNATGEGMEKLNYKVYSFDRYFTNQLTREDWQATIREFQNNLTDKNIDAAISNLPPEIYEISGEEIKNKLKKRRDNLSKTAMLYYDLLIQEAIVNGTSMPEIYELNYNGESLGLNVFRKSDHHLLFSRNYNSKQTSKVDLWDFSEGNDEVKITGNPNGIIINRLPPKKIDEESNKF